MKRRGLEAGGVGWFGMRAKCCERRGCPGAVGDENGGNRPDSYSGDLSELRMVEGNLVSIYPSGASGAQKVAHGVKLGHHEQWPRVNRRRRDGSGLSVIGRTLSPPHEQAALRTKQKKTTQGTKARKAASCW